MRIEKITVGELTAYIESASFKASKDIPITRLRAISQSENPRAASGDIALLVARDEQNQLLSFVGLLPDTIFVNETPQKLWSNSCWWANPAVKENGGVQLLFLSCKLTANKLFFPDLTPHTAKIVAKMKGYNTLTLENGVRGYLHLNLVTLLPSRSVFFSKCKYILRLADSAANFIHMPTITLWKRHLHNKGLQYRILEEVDDEASGFIARMNRQEVFRREKEELNWIIRNPWITTDFLPDDKRYAFTHTVSSFKTIPVTVYSEGNVCAFFILLFRNGNAQLTYFYACHEELGRAADVIFELLLKEKAFTFTAFNRQLSEYLFSHKHPFLLIRRQTKTIGFSKEYEGVIAEKSLQHGDGDCAFV
jgi:hypothetical protein